MATYRRSPNRYIKNSYRYKKRRGANIFRFVLAIILLGALISTFFLGFRFYSIGHELDESKALIETTKEENLKLQEQVPKLTESIKDLEGKVENLKDTLWRYTPVVIPETMK